MTSGVDWYNLLILLLSTIAISGIVTLYVLCLAWTNLRSSNSDPLERAAASAAADLIRLNVVSRNLGTLGICDFTNSDSNFAPGTDGATREVRSFNTVSSLIRTSLFVAKRYKLDTMGEQAAGDLSELEDLKGELHKKMLAAIKSDGSGKIYEHVKRVLMASNRGGEKLESLTIKLGTARGKFALSPVPAEADDDAAVCQSGRLKTLTPLTVPYSKIKLTLHQQVREKIALNPGDFVPDNATPDSRLSDSPLPTVMLIEAQFATQSKKADKRGLVTSNRSICLIATNETKNQSLVSAPPEGSLALSFPQGKPSAFTSMESLLTYGNWRGQGAWQQSIKGPVPGPGQLAPPTAPRLQAMNGSESLSIALYHWLRNLPRPVAPARLAALLKEPWPHPSVPRDQGRTATAIGENDNQLSDFGEDDATAALQINSGLLKDSDARVYALLYQNKPTEAGQKALLRCFQALPSKFPASALPIVVDSTGQANLPGRQGLDQSLAFDLLNSIYSTNLAAQDSLSAAKLIQSSALRAYRSSKERLFLAQTDLDSLSNRLRLSNDNDEIKSLKNEIDWRNNRIAYENNEQKKQLKAISLSQIAIVNATAVASQSFECGSKLFQLCRTGINRLDNIGGGKAYLLGKRYVFSPLTTALQENDIFSEAASPWLAKKMTIYGTVRQVTDLPATKIKVEGRALSELQAETPPAIKAEPAVIVYTPSMQLLYFRDYPFKGLPVPENQLIYYCQNGYFSGEKSGQKIAWSILVRDLVANHEYNEAHQRLGQPLLPPATGWCRHALNIDDKGGKSHDDDNCPGLAAEWQLRSPLLYIDDAQGNVLKGTTLSDPESGQRVQQIPPVGPDLM
ncbi:MAG: hypothetical protein JSS83_09060 [Cyanobacteria bacterium SZAS LIN-3]|nr:hypothetical protein [Cyanobacteria bacterium SZAS LIN-3]